MEVHQSQLAPKTYLWIISEKHYTFSLKRRIFLSVLVLNSLGFDLTEKNLSKLFFFMPQGQTKDFPTFFLTKIF